ncbi:MAG TPA: sugar O-acetyltransferase [Halococcus sp.]|nr:sugar O-acetyltransferase [Halococcus sp.]
MTSEKEKMLEGRLYDPDDPELVAGRERTRRLTHQYNRTGETDHERREDLLRELLGSTGDELQITPPFRCDYGDNIHLGENVYANFECVVLDVCQVEIGRNCMLGPSVHIYTATHPLNATERNAGAEYGKPVTLGDNVWVGGRAVLNPGITVGDGAVVGSGAVVTEDVPSGVVVQGNPATVVKELE